MTDLVVTVPKDFWPQWVEEGDAAGEPATGEEWGFYMGGRYPPIGPGDRLYIVAWGRLRGFAPVTRVQYGEKGFAICRRAEGVAVTIAEPIPGFRGWRKRWWPRDWEKSFPDWMSAGIPSNRHPNLGPGRRRLA